MNIGVGLQELNDSVGFPARDVEGAAVVGGPIVGRLHSGGPEQSPAKPALSPLTKEATLKEVDLFAWMDDSHLSSSRIASI